MKLKCDWWKTDNVHLYDYIFSSLSRGKVYDIEMLERTSSFSHRNYAIVVFVRNTGQRKDMSCPFKCERQTSRIFGRTLYQMSSKDLFCEQKNAYHEDQQYWKFLNDLMWK